MAMLGIDWFSFAMGFIVCATIAGVLVAVATRLLRWSLGSRWLTALVGALIGYRIPPVETSDKGIIDRVWDATRRRE